MAHLTADRVKETTTTTGTGAITLAGAIVGFRAFSSVLSIGDTCYYSIASLPGAEWEVGIGTYSALNTLTRTTVLSSSNAGAAVTFSAGTKEIFITAAASRFLQADNTGNFSPTLTNTYNFGSSSLVWAANYANKFISSNSSAQSLTDGAAIFNGASGAILIDDAGHKRISWNDGGGNFNIRAGNYYNGTSAAVIYAKGSGDTNSGAATITFNSDSTDGVISMSVASIGVPGATVAYSKTLTLATTGMSYDGNITATTFIGALTGNASGSAATFTSTTQNSQFNSIGVGVAASTTAGRIDAGNIILSGYVSAVGGSGQLQAVSGSASTWYNAFLRNDASNVYLMSSAVQTTQALATNATWNAYRPFSWSLTTGAVTIDGTGIGTTFGGTITGTRLISNIATGTAPLAVTSTTLVTNLNADLLDGLNSTTANTASTIVARDSSGGFSAGTITAVGGIKSSDTVQPSYQILLDFGADTLGTWRKIITATLSAGTQYSTHGFKIKITDPNANHATQGSVNVDEVVYYVACVRSEGTVIDTPDLCVVRGPASHVRAVKLATGSYEIQVQPEAQYREYLITIESYATNGAHTIVYSNGSTAGSAGTATYSAAVGGATTWVDKLQSTGDIISLGNVGIGTASPGVRLSVDSGATALNSNFNSTNASGVYLRFQNSGTSIGDVGSGGNLFSGGTAGDFGLTSRAGNLVFGTGSTERMRLDASGNLGVGTTSPTNYKGSGSPAFVVGNTRQIGLVSGLGSLGVYGSALTFNSTIATDISPNTFTVLSGTNQKGGSAIVSNYDGKLSFYVYDAGAETGGTRTVNLSTVERMTIDASGNAGIGTSSPVSKLHVVGDIQQDNANYLKGKLAAGTVTRLFGLNASNSLYIGSIDANHTGGTLFVKNGVTQMTLDSAGAVGINYTPIASTTSKLQMAGDISLLAAGANTLHFNSYYTTAWKARNAGFSGAIRFDDAQGSIQFWTSPASVLADANSNIANTMSLTAAGNLTATSFNSITGLSAAVGSTPGTAAIGTSTTVARSDHVHPLQTTISGNAATATSATNLYGTAGNYIASTGPASTSYFNSIQVREIGLAGAQASAMAAAPRLSFHWSGLVASSIAMEASGRIGIFNNPGTGYEALVCAGLQTASIDNNGIYYARSNYSVLNTAQTGWNTAIDRNGGDSWIVYGGNSVRAPIFYDSNDTGYYVDPATATILSGYSKINLTNGSSSLEDGRGVVINGSYTNGFYSTRFRKWDDGGGLPLYIQQTTSTANVWSNVASFGASNTRYHFHVDGTGYSSSDFRAPIFYDSNDTAYFANPASISSYYGLAIRGDNSASDSGNQLFLWGAGDSTSSAIGFKSNAGEFPNPTGQGDGYNTYLTMDTAGRGWVFRRGTGGTDFNSAYNAGWILNNGIAQFNASTRSPIFYDSENTAYYTDPASTSVLNALTVGGSSVVTSARYRWSVGAFDAGVTTDNFITDLSDNGHLSQGFTAHKAPWSYAGNSDVQTGIFDIEMAGTAVSTWHDGSYYTSLVIRPTTGTGGGSVFIYNNQGASYSPGWRQVWTSATSNYCYSDIRGTILYDTSDTGYYIDPNSASDSALRVRGGALFGPNTSWSSYLYIGTNGNIDVNTATVATTNGNLHLDAANGNVMYLNNYATSSYTIAAQSIRSPIFYDSADSGYYWDPNTSSAHRLQTPSGYLDLGAMNASFCHFQTDRAKYYFNKTVTVNGEFQIYDDVNTRLTQTTLVIRGTSPTIYFRDTDNNVAMLHNNSNLLYVLRGATDSESWTQVGGYWPVYWDLTNNNATFGGSIWAAGNVTAYSDIKLKENIETVDNALEKTIKLRGVYYTRKDDEKKERRLGVIAQEVKEVLPEVVRFHQDKEDEEGTYAVDYGNISGLLIEAIKEQQLIIDAQEERINRLERLVERLTS